MNDFTENRHSFQLPLFDFHTTRICGLSEEETTFYKFLTTMESLLSPQEKNFLFSEPRTGRKGYSGFQILCVESLKLFRRCDTVREVLKLIGREPNYQYLLGFDNGKVPSEASISKRVRQFENRLDMSSIHRRLAESYYKDRLVFNLSIDSTPIDACEKPVKKDKRETKGKRGRKVKGSAEETEYKEKLKEQAEIQELQNNGDVREYLATLENRCSITGKKNSKGNMDWRIGYKAHLAVDDNGIPVSYVVTGASVHDSKVAIPLLRMADKRCDFLYALMDSGYWSKEIGSFTENLGKVPVIDPKADRNGNKYQMDYVKQQRYKARTTVERANSELKACFLPDRLHSRGFKARFDIEIAILLLAMKRMRMVLMKERKIRQQKQVA